MHNILIFISFSKIHSLLASDLFELPSKQCLSVHVLVRRTVLLLRNVQRSLSRCSRRSLPSYRRPHRSPQRYVHRSRSPRRQRDLSVHSSPKRDDCYDCNPQRSEQDASSVAAGFESSMLSLSEEMCRLIRLVFVPSLEQ